MRPLNNGRQAAPLVRARWAALFAAASLAAFGLTAALTYGVDWVQRRDARLLYRLHAHRESWPGDVAAAVVHLGDPLPQLALLGVLVAIAIHLDRRREAVAAAVLVLGADLTTQILKGLLAHPRHQPLLGYEQIAAEAFPSGHATAMAAMTYAYLLVLPKRWWPLPAALAFLTVCVGTSSVLLHKHYPSDVLGGILIASAWFGAVLAVFRSGYRIQPRVATRWIDRD
jgi:membrane-associated phospholipid phosphatase